MPTRSRLRPAISEVPSDYPFAHDIRVRFAETDAMGVMHHGSYVPFLEEARVEYLRHLGHPYQQIRAGGWDFAVLELFCQYLRSARFEEVVTVHTRMAWRRGAAFQMDYLLLIGEEVCALGATVHGVVDSNGRAARPPVWLAELLDGAGPQSRKTG